MVPPRSDTKRTWIRKMDGDMHIVDAEEQPQVRWYPGNREELLWIIHRYATTPELKGTDAKACGSH